MSGGQIRQLSVCSGFPPALDCRISDRSWCLRLPLLRSMGVFALRAHVLAYSPPPAPMYMYTHIMVHMCAYTHIPTLHTRIHDIHAYAHISNHTCTHTDMRTCIWRRRAYRHEYLTHTHTRARACARPARSGGCGSRTLRAPWLGTRSAASGAPVPSGSPCAKRQRSHSYEASTPCSCEYHVMYVPCLSVCMHACRYAGMHVGM